jgi:hypothetical protein
MANDPPTRADLVAGDTFAFPLPDGRYGACRVLRVHGRGPGAEDRHDVLMAALAWIGTEPPPITEPRLRLLLRMTGHGMDGRFWVCWLAQASVPATVHHLGVIQPTAAEADVGQTGYCGWQTFTGRAHAQWRWDEQHGIAPADDEAELQRREYAAARSWANKQRAKALARLTREDLLVEVLIGGPLQERDPEGIQAARAIVRDTVAALLALGPDEEVAKLDELHHFIERFNEDEAAQDTLFREGILDVFDDLLWLAGLEDYGDELGDPPWRDF